MSQKLRIIIPLALLGAAGVAYAAHVSAGTLSAFGWESISLICPIGALGTMLASKMLVPRAVISIVLAVAAILLLGRAFCGWLCPVPVWSKLRGIFKKGRWGGRAPFRCREARPENLLRRRMLLLRRPQTGRFAPHHPGRHPAFRGHLRVPGVLPGVPRGPLVRPGVSAHRAVRRRRCYLVGAHHSRVDSRRGDLLP
ncbi:MAG: 4Fe-4S binding protein [Adlercreutzia equolifaciens]